MELRLVPPVRSVDNEEETVRHDQSAARRFLADLSNGTLCLDLFHIFFVVPQGKDGRAFTDLPQLRLYCVVNPSLVPREIAVGWQKTIAPSQFLQCRPLRRSRIHVREILHLHHEVVTVSADL